MTPRQEALLKALIKEYTRTAEPVGSAALTHSAGVGISPATVRNELAALEEQGFITQPHTSAGRIPTEKGFRFYVSQTIDQPAAADRRNRTFKVPGGSNVESAAKSVARDLASETTEAVLVGFGRNEIYATGLPYLFSQPEFRAFEQVIRIAELMDRLEEVAENMFPRLPRSIEIWLGAENPFGEECGLLVTRFGAPRAGGMLALLGPLRMDYERNYRLLASAKEVLDEITL